MNFLTSKCCILIIFFGFTACIQNQKKISDVDQGNQKSKPNILFINNTEKCFFASLGKDSAFLTLKKNGSEVSGKLAYQFFEKDNNKGTLIGNLDGDTLNLNYTFQSEGSTSTRFLKFLIDKNQIFEIYGNSKTEIGKGFIYSSVDCKSK